MSALDSANAKAVEPRILSEEGKTDISISHHVLPELLKMYDEVWEVKDGKATLIN